MWVVFKAFKTWLHKIYSSVRNIKYTDNKGILHEIHISPEINAVFDDLISEGKYKPEIISSQNNNQNNKQNNNAPTLDNQRFLNDESEQRYSGAKNQSGIIAKINNAARSVIHGLKGDY